jgi:hypothetical protein
MSNVSKAGRVVHIFGVQLSDRIVAEQSCFHCFLTDVRLFPVSVFIFSKMITLGSSDVFMVLFSDVHGQLPPCHHRCGWEPLLHGPASPGVSTSVVRCTPPARLRRGCSYLPRPHVYGPWLGQVRGQRGDTPQPNGVVDGNYHRGRAG